MPLDALVLTGRLDAGLVLAPERYDPRRSSSLDGVPLGSLVSVKGRALSTKKMDPTRRYLVLDAGDAAEGFLRPKSDPVDAADVNSAKKPVRPGDVIISRLRPYLRQVALVDGDLARGAGGAEVVVSTEFYVLRPGELGDSVAFLVPFLLSPSVQEVLAASQEGGHHPRFSKETLLSLPVPQHVVDERDEVSSAVEEAVRAIRSARNRLRMLSERSAEAGAG